MIRVGMGYDVHRLVKGRDLILAGVKIDHHLGLDGHSDADVLAHAISDALLGSLALGDIGKHFPDTDLRYKGADSLMLLSEVYKLVRNKSWSLVNLDTVIICQEPKLRGYIDKMRENLARVLQTDIENISVKATTEEGLGFSGRQEGIGVKAVVLIEK